MEITHFTPAEMTCKCGCGSVRMVKAFMEKLERIRSTYYQRPMAISSGFRCLSHDMAVGGSGQNHSKGFAADIIIPKGQNLFDFVAACFTVNIARVVLYHNKPHVHVDDNPNLPSGLFVK